MANIAHDQAVLNGLRKRMVKLKAEGDHKALAGVEKHAAKLVARIEEFQAQDQPTAEIDAAPKIVGYARVFDGGCDHCAEASNYLYSTEDLMPMHENCGCGVEPVFEEDVKASLPPFPEELSAGVDETVGVRLDQTVPVPDSPESTLDSIIASVKADNPDASVGSNFSKVVDEFVTRPQFDKISQEEMDAYIEKKLAPEVAKHDDTFSPAAKAIDDVADHPTPEIPTRALDTEEEVAQHFSDDFYDSRPIEQFDALADYGGNGGVELNDALRTGEALDADFAEWVQTLDEAMAPLPNPTIVHRGLKGDFKSIFGEDAQVGGVIHDPAYLSTTHNEALAQQFVGRKGVTMEIEVPADTPVAFLQDNGLGSELVLGRGQTLKITEVLEDGNKIKAQVVRADTKASHSAEKAPVKEIKTAEVPTKWEDVEAPHGRYESGAPKFGKSEEVPAYRGMDEYVSPETYQDVQMYWRDRAKFEEKWGKDNPIAQNAEAFAESIEKFGKSWEGETFWRTSEIPDDIMMTVWDGGSADLVNDGLLSVGFSRDLVKMIANKTQGPNRFDIRIKPGPRKGIAPTEVDMDTIPEVIYGPGSTLRFTGWNESGRYFEAEVV